MKPRKTFGIQWDDDERERLEDSMRDWWTEDDQMERERDLKEGPQKENFDDDDCDDIKYVL